MIRIGIICPSEIALRRFMPAIQKLEEMLYVGVAHADAYEWFGEEKPNLSVIDNEKQKAEQFRTRYGGKVFGSYSELIDSDEIDAVYLPLPPALHFRWAKTALEHGKHIFLEKPSTTAAADTKELIRLAKKNELAVHENYMFIYHDQLRAIRELAERIGGIRLYRIAFGFPRRSPNDFRYNKSLGGGALLDCGGYTLKLAKMLLGQSARVTTSQLNKVDGFEVDIYGAATLVNDAGVTAQVSFGMDNAYKCELEIWGSRGSVKAGRIFTAPAGFEPTAELTADNETQTIVLPEDDTFAKSISAFCRCVRERSAREAEYTAILKQSELVDSVKGGI